MDNSDLELANYLLKKLYQFDEALKNDDVKRMKSIVKKLDKQVKKYEHGNPLHSLLAYVSVKLGIVLYTHGTNVKKFASPEEIYNQLCETFKPLAFAGLMLDGMTLEEAEVSYSLGMRPVWKPVNPFTVSE